MSDLTIHVLADGVEVTVTKTGQLVRLLLPAQAVDHEDPWEPATVTLTPDLAYQVATALRQVADA